jgi:hypothetical protein
LFSQLARPQHGQHDDDQVALEGLTDFLDPSELITALTTGRGHPPRLTVASRRTLLSEDIYADAHFYWWGWAERIGPVTAPALAAQVISLRLRADPEVASDDRGRPGHWQP